MPRSAILGGLVFCLAVAGAVTQAAAEPWQDVARELQAQGYEVLEVRRTWLGRIKIEAETPDHRREIVLDRGTGEIRRDLVEQKPGSAATPRQGVGEVVGREKPAPAAKRAARPAPVQPPAKSQGSGGAAAEAGRGGVQGGGRSGNQTTVGGGVARAGAAPRPAAAVRPRASRPAAAPAEQAPAAAAQTTAAAAHRQQQRRHRGRQRRRRRRHQRSSEQRRRRRQRQRRRQRRQRQQRWRAAA